MDTATDTSRELCLYPMWREEDLGKPLPDSLHAASVALPLWRHVVGYEESAPDILAKLQCGYPRFVHHPYVRQLFSDAEKRFAAAGEQCFVFPSQPVAARCIAFLHDKAGVSARLDSFPDTELQVVTFPEAAASLAKQFWQHYGDIVSSRRALAALESRNASPAGTDIKPLLRARIAGWAGVAPHDVFLYPTGMAALAHGLRLAQLRAPELKSAQLGFPYVDGLKIQSVWGPGAHFFSSGTDTDIDALEAILKTEKLSAVLTEFPSNPLLQCANIERLAKLVHAHSVPLIIDDTLGTFLNVDLLRFADMIASSLTKYVSGAGDVMAGSLIVNPASAFKAQLADLQQHDYEDLLWEEDAQALANNSVDFPERMRQINVTTEAICKYLRRHPMVERVYFPKYQTFDNYARARRRDAGYGGLFSLLLKNAGVIAPRFYDALRISKGPSLGNNFSLACPYTLLAHFNELDWAESIGISRYLIRISIGLEDTDDLIYRFDEALSHANELSAAL